MINITNKEEIVMNNNILTLVTPSSSENKSMHIEVTIKNVYGQETIYPVCDIAKKFVDLLQRKTLTLRDIKHIKGLGYAVDVVYSITTM